MICRIVGVCVVALATAGCSWTWPKHGGGGLAERPVPNNSYETALYNRNPPLSRTSEAELWKLRLVVAKQRRDTLIAEGGETHFPAITQDISMQLVRAARELDGGMRDDAVNDMIRAESMLDALENRLTAIGKHGKERVAAKAPSAPLAGLERVSPLKCDAINSFKRVSE